MNLDFADSERRAQFETARDLVTSGYRILRDRVGVDNPADNAFLREATICAHQRLVWLADRGGTDAHTRTGEEVEIKSTRLDDRPTIAFPTSRYVSETVIERFRAAAWWAFGIFDVYEELVAIYRAEHHHMIPIIDDLERRMNHRLSKGEALENNPKINFRAIRPHATTLYFDKTRYSEVQTEKGWTIERRS